MVRNRHPPVGTNTEATAPPSDLPGVMKFPASAPMRPVGGSGLRLAFVSGLSDKKLAQKLLPLSLLPEVAAVDVYRRVPFALPPKVRWIPLTPLGRVRTAGELEKFARLLAAGSHYDLLVGCFQILHGFWAALAGAVWRIPVVQLIITDVAWNMRHAPAAWTMLRADACGVRGPGATTALRELGYAGPVEVIHNPMAMPEGRNDQGRKDNDILVVGDMAAEKDYPWLLTILGRLASRGVPFAATLCGHFPESFRRQVATAGLAERLRFPGHLAEPELDAAYAASRVLLMTSHTEGLPMAAVEGMAHGLATVVTGVGELPWLVRDGQDGRVVPHGDTETMAGALEVVLTRPGLARDMGENGRRRIRELAPLFRHEAVALAWRQLLVDLSLVAPG